MADHPNEIHPCDAYDEFMEEARRDFALWIEQLLDQADTTELVVKLDSLGKELTSVQLGLEMQHATNASLRSQLARAIKKQKASRKKLMDARGTIRVFCRILPSNKLHTAISDVGPTSLKVTKLDCTGRVIRKAFEVDKIYTQVATQEELFCEILDLVDCAMSGERVGILAHGYTGTGKTHTISGKPTDPGLLPRSIHRIFSNGNSSLIVQVAMVEIYGKKIYDLLPPKKKELDVDRKFLEEDGICRVKNMTIKGVSSVEECLKVYYMGLSKRHTSSTSFNVQSSRGHVVFSLLLSQDSRRGSLNVVDLAGGERYQGEDNNLAQESISINQSLLYLRKIVREKRNKANKRKEHIEFNNSLLTRYLKPCLEEDSKLLFLMTVSPDMDMAGKTIETLNFAAEAMDCPV